MAARPFYMPTRRIDRNTTGSSATCSGAALFNFLTRLRAVNVAQLQQDAGEIMSGGVDMYAALPGSQLDYLWFRFGFYRLQFHPLYLIS